MGGVLACYANTRQAGCSTHSNDRLAGAWPNPNRSAANDVYGYSRACSDAGDAIGFDLCTLRIKSLLSRTPSALGYCRQHDNYSSKWCHERPIGRTGSA